MSVFNETDLLYGCNGEIHDTIPQTEAIINAIAIIIAILVAIFGNSIVVVAIYKFPKLRTLTNALLCSMAVTDLLTPIVRLLSMSVAFLEARWIFGCQWCQLSSNLGVFLCSASILHLCVISLERYLTIVHPMKRDRYITRNVFFVVVAGIWLLSLSMSLFPYFGIVKMAFNPDILDCAVYLTEDPKLSIILAVCYFGNPFVIMIVVYHKIYKSVKIQTSKISKYSLGSKAEKQKQKVRKEWKAVKTVIVVIGLFFVLWLPYFCVNCVTSFHPHAVPSWINRFVLVLAYINSCCNWIIYSVMNRQLRHAYMRLLRLGSMKKDRGRGLSVADKNEDFFAIRRKYERNFNRKCTRKKFINFVLQRKVSIPTRLNEEENAESPPPIKLRKCQNNEIDKQISQLDVTQLQRKHESDISRMSSSIGADNDGFVEVTNVSNLTLGIQNSKKVTFLDETSI